MIGKRLSHYEILDKIGQGGMGTVYRARDHRLDRDVALKVLPPEVAGDPARRARFEREAKAIAALNHPNVVTIHSVEEVEGQSLLTMELIDGEPLSRRIRPGGMPLAELLEVAIPVCDALAAAHRAGITHRDLKPDNVMVTRDGHVKVLDFGLAKLATSPPSSLAGEVDAGADPAATVVEAGVTQEGRIVGTVNYMSPEQAAGQAVDARSDVFSLGILLYEMATGDPPFHGDSPVTTLTAILRDRPLPMAERRADVPGRLQGIVDRCLEKEAPARYPDAGALSQALAALRTGDGAQAAAPPARGSSGWAWAMIAVTVVAIGGTMVLLGVFRSDSPWAPEQKEEAAVEATASDDTERMKIVVLPFENLGDPDDAYFAAGMTEEITSRLAAVGQLGVISRKSAVQYSETDKTIAQIGRELDVDYVLEGTVRWARSGQGASRVRITPQLIRVSDDTHLWADAYDRVIDDVFAVQSEIAAQVVGQLGVSLEDPEQAAMAAIPTQNTAAYEAYLKAREYQGVYGESGARQAMELLQQAVDLDPRFVEAWALLSEVHSSLVHWGWDRSPARQQLAREAAEKALALAPDSPAAHKAMGQYHYRVHRDYPRAEAEYARAARQLPNDVDLIMARCFVKRRQGDFAEAVDLVKRALVLDPLNPGTWTESAFTFLVIRRYEESIAAADKVLQLSPDLYLPVMIKVWAQWRWKPDLPRTRRWLEAARPVTVGTLIHEFFWQHIYEGDPAGALAVLEDAPDEVAGDVGWVRTRPFLEGFALRQAGDAAGARAAFEAARADLEARLQITDDFRFDALLGVTLAALGQKEAAIAVGQRATAKYPLSRDAMEAADVARDLAWIYAWTGESGRALDLLDTLLGVAGPVSVAWLQLDPRWQPLWGHPGFEALVAKYAATP